MVGETIGSYQILRQLGAGAMGEVYLAEHRHLKRKAALKLLAREIVGRPDLLERFFLEARATSAIAHPGIVQVFDCEIDPTGRPYIVMEFLEGETLAAVLARKGALSPVVAARLARSMAEALEAAHAKGIVHRDIKPENVFVQAQPPDTVKMVDFGIAKLAGDFRAGQVHQTRSGAMMGTPLYMSPEQCRDSASIDYRTDIYSLGCVLFEMLTGQPPFSHTSIGDLIVAHMNEAPRDVRAVNPAVPPALAELVGALLRKDPAQRPADMRAVADRIVAFLAGVTTIPGPGPQVPAAAPAAPAALAGARTSTFGDSASEMVDDELRPARRSRVGIAVALAVVVLAAGGWLAARGGHAPPAPAPATGEVAATTSPPARVEPPAPAAPPLPTSPPSSAAAIAARPEPEPAPSPSSASAPSGRGKKQGARRSAETSASEVAGLKLAREEAPSTARPGTGSAEAAPDTAARSAKEETASSPPPGAGSADPTGAWEGPWQDAPHRQNGRLYVQLRADGTATGWLFNAVAHESFRMSGRMTPAGGLDLTCLCPPPQQVFTARGTLRGAAEGELRGQLVLSTGAGAFGQSQVFLRRTTPR